MGHMYYSLNSLKGVPYGFYMGHMYYSLSFLKGGLYRVPLWVICTIV